MRKGNVINILLVCCTILAACVPPPVQVNQEDQGPVAESNSTAVPQPEPTVVSSDGHSDAPHTSDVDLTRLQVGDGKFSTSPQSGYVYSCQTQFNGGGATGIGDWMNGDGTWDATTKAVVDGSVSWPHSFTITVQGDQRVFTGNDLPDHPTGTFPVSPADDAYAVDRNPNSIQEQSIILTLPANPIAAAQPACVGGEVGIMLSGVVIFSAFDAEGRDAPAHEVQDACDGHPQASGFYHYHSLSDCFVDTAAGHSALMGYAFDGFGLFGYYGEDGSEVTNSDLDECHGHTHVIAWDGQQVEMYHYHATHEFPYVVGCFKGTPSVRAISAGEGQGSQTQQGGGLGGPPQEAINACLGLSQGASCSVGPTTGACQIPPNAMQLACVPTGGPPP